MKEKSRSVQHTHLTPDRQAGAPYVHAVVDARGARVRVHSVGQHDATTFWTSCETSEQAAQMVELYTRVRELLRAEEQARLNRSEEAQAELEGLCVNNHLNGRAQAEEETP